MQVYTGRPPPGESVGNDTAPAGGETNCWIWPCASPASRLWNVKGRAGNGEDTVNCKAAGVWLGDKFELSQPMPPLIRQP